MRSRHPLFTLALLFACSLQAVERVWTGATGADWMDENVWSVDGVPSSAPTNTDTVTINNGATVALTGAALDDTNRFALVQLNGSERGTLVVGPGAYLPTVQLKVGQEGTAPDRPGHLIVDGGSVHAAGQQVIGYDSTNNPGRIDIINNACYTSTAAFRVYTGHALVSNASFTATFTSYIHGSSTTNVFEVVDGTVNMTAFAIGRDVQNASGKACRNVLRMRSGFMRTTADLEIGHTGTGGLTITGAVEQTGGQLLSASGNVRLPISSSAVGEYLLSGGSFSIHNGGDSLFLGGRDGPAKGFFAMTGGSFTNKGITQVGSYARGTGALAIGGGTAVFEKFLQVGAVAGSTGDVSLTDGSLVLPVANANLNIGNASNAFGRCTISGGYLSGTGRSINVGSASFGNGVLTQTGGVVSNSSTVVGAVSSASGNLTVSNGLWSIAGGLIAGQTNSTGRCEVSGGVMTMTGAMSLGNQHAGSGSFAMNAGAVSNNGVNAGNVLGSTGSVEINGGQLYSAGEFFLGHGSAGKGGAATFTMSGGRLLANMRFIVGSYGSATAAVCDGEIEALANGRTDQSFTVGRDPGTFGRLELTGGTLKGANELVLARDNGSTGLVYVAGGQLFFNALRRANGLHALHLAGGTLHPYNRNTAFTFNATLTNDIGYGETGTRFGLSATDKDGSEREVTVAVTFSGNGGLAKRDAGTVTLGGTLTYTGDTVVEAGTLSLSNSVASLASSAIEVQAGATLDVSLNRVTPFAFVNGQTLTGAGTVKGPVRLATGSTLSGGTAGEPAVLTIDGDLTLDADCTLLFNMLSGSYSRIHVTGNLTLPATANLTVNGSAAPEATGHAFLTWGGSLDMPVRTRWEVAGNRDPLVVLSVAAKQLTISYFRGTLISVL